MQRVNFADLPDRIAKPGDPDLSVDVSASQVVSCDRDGDTFRVTCSGGCGFFVDEGTRERTDVWDQVHGQLRVSLPATRPEHLDYYEDVLNRWREQRILFRLVGAPGKMALMIGDDANLLPLPTLPERWGV